MKKEKLHPIDLQHLRDKALSAHRYLDLYDPNSDEADVHHEYLTRGKDVLEVLLRDIEHYLAHKEISN